jgi:hypothetical protein
MRQLLTYILLLTSYYVSAQNEIPRIQYLEVEDKLFHGQIDKKPITIYLRFNRYANYHRGAYAVKGWYYYNKVQIQVPLTGLYESGELFLYHFTDSSKSKELLNFLEVKSNHMEDMKYYKNLTGFKEKFIFSDSTYSWTDNKKLLKVELQDEDLKIKQTYEFLMFDNTKAFNLNNLGWWNWDFKIVANNQNKIILEYDHPSKLHNRGRCAAGSEKGFMVIEFDNSNGFVGSKNFILESCLFSIETDTQNQLAKGVMEYSCESYQNLEAYTLIVDYNKAEIIRKDKN